MRSLVRNFAVILAILVTCTMASGFTQAGNRAMTQADVAAGISDVTFLAAATPCTLSGNRAMTQSGAAACIKNDGTCPSSTTRIATLDGLNSCKIVFSTITGDTDPWLTAGFANWAGSGGFVSETGAPGAIGGAQSLVGGAISQTIAPNPVLNGTSIVIRFQTNNSRVSGTQITCAGGLPDAVAQASATVALLSGGTTIASFTDTTSGWHTDTISAHATAGTAAYSIQVTQTTGTASQAYVTYSGVDNSLCRDHTTTITASGRVTDVTDGNT